MTDRIISTVDIISYIGILAVFQSSEIDDVHLLSLLA